MFSILIRTVHQIRGSSTPCVPHVPDNAERLRIFREAYMKTDEAIRLGNQFKWPHRIEEELIKHGELFHASMNA